jgi:predicted DsbA family dithiol-disulfide isomerase
MQIEIWSDVMCPFCYIGKRRLEQALDQFSSKEEITITWKSFLLNPDLKTDLSISTSEYLAQEKGMPLEKVKEMFVQVTQMAKEVGLDYDLEKTVVASSFNAHRFLHFALSQGKQLEAKELIFKAHFIEFKNIDDIDTLVELGISIGLDADGIREVITSNEYREAVKYDIYEAQQLGVRGVPFFVFNNQFGISGAQPLEVFLETLEKAGNSSENN